MMKSLLPNRSKSPAQPQLIAGARRWNNVSLSPGERVGVRAGVILTFILLFRVALAQAQPTNLPPPQSTAISNSNPSQVQSPTQRIEAMRDACLQGRRIICGKILRVFPDGLVVESGYTNLLRAPLNQSWLVRGTAAASLAPNLVEGAEPGCVAVGTVYLTSLPKSRGAKPAQYDYVIIEAYPAGRHTYTTVGDVSHTVRRFAANLPKAVQLNLEEAKN